MTDFSDRYHLDRQATNHLRLQEHQRDFRWVNKFLEVHQSSLPSPSGSLNIIDIGCSDGSFLELFAHLGQLTGIEINHHQALLAEERLDKVLSSLPTVGKYDLVIIRGTLQHLTDENEFFQFLFSNLKFNGVVAILANPNAQSPIYRRTGSLPALEVTPGFESNYNVYTPFDLAMKLNSVGISTKSVAFPYFSTIYAKPLVDLPAGLFSLITGKRMGYPFPRNMFNLLGVKTIEVG
jgi:SAM-dependent methyltransferase